MREMKRQMCEMKDSGIEWIGEIPVGWEVCRIKELFHEVNERCENGNDYTLLSVSEYYGVSPKSQRISDDDMLTHAETLDGYKVCHENDIVMNIMLAWKRALGVSQYEGIVSPAYCVYRTNKDLDSKYFHYLYRTDMYANLFKQFSTGIIDSRLRLYPDKFLSLKCQVPPLEEQHRISTYLDTKCEKIDSIIARQQEVIEKLKTYKLSVITEAVTKGLNPDVRMKDSGVEWIGVIPQDSILVRLKNLVGVSDGTHDTPQYVDESENSHPLVTSKCISDGFIIESLANHISEADYCEINKRSKVSRFDVLMPMIGTVGNPALVQAEPNFAIKNVALLRTNSNEILGKYVVYILSSQLAIIQFDSLNRGGVQNFISQEKLKNLLFVKHSDIRSIVNYLDKKCSAIDSAIAKKQAIIEKLTAYKKSLIYEVVTGKREVNPKKEAITVICPVGIPTNEEEYARILLFQKIITMCGNHLKGRTHLMKILHAIELGIGFSFNTEYTRHYHGPYDKHIENYENALVRKGWIKLKKGKNIEYIVTNSTAYKSDYKRIFGKYNKEIERIIDFFKSMKRTSKAEKVATLLASWNDFLIDGIAAPDDHMIISDVMNNWTENKSHIDYATWQEILNQMKKENIIPHGYCNHTIKAED